MESKTLLDTDILSGVMRPSPKAVQRAHHYLTDHPCLTISLITRFEILRGLKAKGATTRLTVFQAFCNASGGFAGH